MCGKDIKLYAKNMCRNCYALNIRGSKLTYCRMCNKRISYNKNKNEFCEACGKIDKFNSRFQFDLNKISNPRHYVMAKLRNEGKTYEYIAEYLNLTGSGVRYILSNYDGTKKDRNRQIINKIIDCDHFGCSHCHDGKCNQMRYVRKEDCKIYKEDSI